MQIQRLFDVQVQAVHRRDIMVVDAVGDTAYDAETVLLLAVLIFQRVELPAVIPDL